MPLTVTMRRTQRPGLLPEVLLCFHAGACTR